MTTLNSEPEMLDEYDFTKGVREKYVQLPAYEILVASLAEQGIDSYGQKPISLVFGLDQICFEAQSSL